MRQERQAPEQRGIAQQAGNQHAHAAPAVRNTAPEPERQQSAEHVQTDEEPDGFRAHASPVDQVERKEEDKNTGLNGDQHRIGQAHEEHTGRAKYRPKEALVARFSRCPRLVGGQRRPTSHRDGRHQHASRLEYERAGHPGPLIQPAAARAS